MIKYSPRFAWAFQVMLFVVAYLAALPSFAQALRSTAPIRTEYVGNYRLSRDHILGIDQFTMDSGERALLLSDYASGVVRRLFPIADDELVMGSGFNAQSPVELTVHIKRHKKGAVRGIGIRAPDGPEKLAAQIPLRQEDVSFKQADATLEGTLIVPDTKGLHPAVILLHGSGPLTRYSFGPYPHFFTSLGFAVLIFDKRGAGASSGFRMDASTGKAMKAASYPDDLANDALAAFDFLRRHKDIDPRKIGFWGSSEGGMLAMQVAARSKDAAFAINSSGFMGTLADTFRYQVGAILQSNGASQEKIDKQRAFVDLWLHVAQTGEDWDRFETAQREIIQSDGYWVFQTRGPFTSLEQLRWDWDHVLSFDSLPALAKISCPVLAVFGGSDPLTPAANAAERMRRTLTEAGHKDFTIKIFANASHSLKEMPSGNRMAPGVFDTLRSWLRQRI